VKTQIIRLDVHDDFISTRDKMGWGQTGRILLIWPESGHVLNRQLDLVLMQRHSQSLGAQLALVANDPQVRAHAYDLAIPVFKSLGHAQRGQWRVARRRRAPRRPAIQPPEGPPQDLRAIRQELRPAAPAWLERVEVRVGVFSLGVLAVLALAAALLPGARLTLQPVIRPQSLTLEVSADPNLQTNNLSGSIPARPYTIVVEGRDFLLSQGTQRVPEKAASGQVLFTNLTERAIAIPSGSVVRTVGEDPQRFVTTRSGNMPGGIGNTLSLPVRAVQAGEIGNLPSDSLVAIEGPLGLDLTANNPQPTSGGSSRQAAAPTAFNRRQLYERLEQELRATALSEAQLQLQTGDLLFTSTITLTQVLEQAYDPPALQPSERLNLSLRLEYQVLTALQTDLQTLAISLLDAGLPQGYAPLPETLSIKHLSSPEAGSDAKVTWRIQLERQARAQIAPSQATVMVLGLPPQQAAMRLTAGLPLQSEPQIALAPRWWPRLPLLPFRIAVDSIQ